jgi:hypothetical protein
VLVVEQKKDSSDLYAVMEMEADEKGERKGEQKIEEEI